MRSKLASKEIIAFLSLLLIMAGAIAGCAKANQAPTAYIDSIVPDEATEGETVTFTGHGTDVDGNVVAYSWTSSIDGKIGSSASFTASSLSVGNHTVSLSVQDNNAAWSENVIGNVTIVGVTAKPVILSFTANPNTMSPGESSTLTWEVTAASTVSIDQGIGNVALSGTRAVSPTETTIYTLTAANEAGSLNATVQVIVQAAEDTTPPATPVLASPSDAATLPQPDEEWAFDWSDSSDPESGIAGYQLYVIREGAGAPVIDTFITDSEHSETLGGHIAHEYLHNWTWKVRAQNNAGLWSPWSDIRTFSVEPKITGTLVISQTDKNDSAWFGWHPSAGNVGHGQGFEVTEAGFFHQFRIYLTSDSSTDSDDMIVCSLRDGSGNVLQRASTHGFTAGHGGWQTFNFNLETYLTPGTYYCTCYVENPIAGHAYQCDCNTDDASYPEETHYYYYGTYGAPGDWSNWHHYPLDLVFKAIIKTSP